jgi:hypothetical protein
MRCCAALGLCFSQQTARRVLSALVSFSSVRLRWRQSPSSFAPFSRVRLLPCRLSLTDGASVLLSSLSPFFSSFPSSFLFSSSPSSGEQQDLPRFIHRGRPAGAQGIRDEEAQVRRDCRAAGHAQELRPLPRQAFQRLRPVSAGASESMGVSECGVCYPCSLA